MGSLTEQRWHSPARDTFGAIPMADSYGITENYNRITTELQSNYNRITVILPDRFRFDVLEHQGRSAWQIEFEIVWGKRGNPALLFRVIGKGLVDQTLSAK